MIKRSRIVLLTALVCLSFYVSRSERSFAKDKEFTPEEVIARHIKSIGTPQVLRAVKSRCIYGSASLHITKQLGTLEGQATFVSEGYKVGLVTRYEFIDYTGEQYAYDGKDVTVSYVASGPTSALGTFIDDFHGVMKEGFLGGAMSLAWPLLQIKERRATLTYKKRKIEGRQLHELTYNPRSRTGMNDLRIKLFFDFETFRHVRTEYRGFLSGYLLLMEKFDDFKEVDGMMLPHRYTIDINDGYGQLTMEAKEWLHNVTIDSRFFKVPD